MRDVNRNNESKQVEQDQDELRLSEGAMSNRHPPGSAMSDDESVISSDSNRTSQEKSSFSDPMDNDKSAQSKKHDRDDSSSVEGSDFKKEKQES